MKTVIVWVVVIVAVFLLWSLFQTTKGSTEMIAFSTFLDRVQAGQVERVLIRGSELRGETRAVAPGGKHEFRTVLPNNYPPMYDLMRSKGVMIELEPQRDAPLITALISWAPIIGLIVLWVYFLRMFKRPPAPPGSRP